MNLLLWILQIALALLYFAGGAYKLFSYDELAKVPAAAALSRAGWGALGVLEMIGAVLLIVPAALTWMPKLTPLAAAVLAVETLALACVDARYSLELTVTNPLVWALPIGLAAAFIAYGRWRG
jgi:DoxX-like protein